MHPDQGLRYELAGVLGHVETLRRIAQADDAMRVVQLEVDGLGVLPVTAALAAELRPAALSALGLEDLSGGTQLAARRRSTLLTGPESGFLVLTPGLATLIEAASALDPLAWVEADYTGREGRQAAAVWRSGHLKIGPLLLGPREPFRAATAPFTVALAALGHEVPPPRDAFVSAGLGRHRRTVDWARTAPGTGTDERREY